MSTSGPDDPTAPSQPSPELGGLDPKDLLNAGLETVPPVTLPPQLVDSDATMAVSRPQSTQPRQEAPELPLPEELTNLLPHGNYRVESFLGQGGMGAVYKGMQVRLKRPVAIKIMRRDFGKDHDFEARFEREAQAMAKLNHPNIVSVIDFGEAGPDYLFIVMELIDGADLMDVIRGGQMTQEMALTLLPQICDALQFAHDHGIVHRDIKPSNIMLTRDGRIKMADFGLAKHFDAESSFRTQTGTGMGTPDYAAPEQFSPDTPIDHRADIYALGVMIYQMITGQLPRGAWKPPSQRVEVAPQWDNIVSRAMQNDPADRYQQASEVKTDVSSIPLKQESAKKRSAGTPARLNQSGGAAAKNHEAVRSDRAPVKSRAALAIGTVVIGLIAFTVVFFALKKPEENRRGRQTAEETTSSSDIATPPRALASAPTAAKQTLDLIALVDVQRDRMKAEGNAGANVWTKSGGQLVFTSGDKRAGKISAPVALNGLRDYEVEIGIPTPTESIGLDLPMSVTSQATVVFVPGQTVLLRDGNTSKEFGTWPKDTASPPWKLAARVKFDADGKKGTIAATINGTPVGEWRGALGKLGKTTEPHPDFPGQLVPALYIRSGDSAHSSWTLRVFEGEAKVLRSAAATPAPIAAPALPESGWKPLFTESEWRADSPDHELEDGVLHLKKRTDFMQTQPSADGAIRARIHIREGTSDPSIMLRVSKKEGGYKLLARRSTSTAVLQYINGDKESVELGQYVLPNGLKLGDTLVLELRAQGSLLTGIINEVPAIKVQDDRIKAAAKWGVAANNAWFESVEIQPLPAAATPAPIAAPALPESGWKPLFTDEEWKTSNSFGEFKDGLKHLQSIQWTKPQTDPDGAIRARFQLRDGTQNPSILIRRSASEGLYKLEISNPAVNVYLSFVPIGGAREYIGQYTIPNPPQPGDKLELECRAQGDHLIAKLNGTTVFDLHDARVKGPGEWGINANDAWFESVEVQPLPVAGTPKIIRLFDTADKLPKLPGVSLGQFNTLKLENATVGTDTPSARDLVFRASLKLTADNGGGANLIIRYQVKKGRYILALSAEGKAIELRLDQGGNMRVLQSWPVPLKHQPDDWLSLEIKAIGAQLTVSLAGEVLGTVEDASLMEAGGVRVGALRTGYFKDIEYVLLDAPAASPAPSLPVSESSVSAATKDTPFTNTLGMKFVPVPITGGLTDGKRVLFSMWETRVQDYEVFVKETKRGWPKADISQEDSKHPAVMVSWEDATAFCAWLTEKERKAGKVTDKEVYRLPSDHEWSCAVGIGEQQDPALLPSDNHETLMTVYPWGTGWPPKGKAGNYADQAFHSQFPVVRNEKESRVENEWIEGYTDGFATTAPVGSFPANAYGLHDLGGNVQEWCADWLNKEQTERVLRGASWNHAERYVLRSTNRLRMNPSNRYRNNLGFRVVLESASSTAAVSPSPNLPVSKSSDPKFPPGQWVKLGTLPKTELTPDGWFRANPNMIYGIVDVPGLNGLNHAIRARFRDNAPKGARPMPSVQLIARHSLVENYHAYVMRSMEGFSIRHEVLNQQNKTRLIAVTNLPAADEPGDEFTLEFAAVGKTLLARCQGVWIKEQMEPESTPTQGKPALFISNTDLFRDVEVMNLDGMPEADALKLVETDAVSPSPSPQVSSSTVATATKDAPFVNTLGMKFVPVPITGGPTDGKRVLFSVWETRVQDYALFVKEMKRAARPVDFQQGADHPVVNVRHSEAVEFCAWLTARDRQSGVIGPAEAYRPPSDHEWSCAVGIGDQEDAASPPSAKNWKLQAFPWGGDHPPPAGVGNYYGAETKLNPAVKEPSTLASFDDKFPRTAPVGSFAANASGLHDLGGNVWEWCGDEFEPGKPEKRVLRGASWAFQFRNDLLSSARYDVAADYWNLDVGFRVVLAPADVAH